MRKTRLWIPAACCVAASALLLMAQPNRRPGLYETTSTMTWQQSPLPPGMQMPGGANNPFSGAPHTTQSCITQQMIDKYGGPTPQESPRSQCHLANLNKTEAGMTADYVCTGGFTGTGHFTSTWSGEGTANMKIHFTGNMQMGPQSRPIEWTIDATSTYKGPDCGSVRPVPMPAQ